MVHPHAVNTNNRQMKILKKSYCLAVIIGVLCGMIFFQYNALKQAKEERDIYKNNTYGLLAQIDTLHNDSAIQAYQVQTLGLNVEEYKRYRADDLNTINALKLKLKNVSAVSKQEMEVQAAINVPIKTDTIIQNDTIYPVKTVRLHNDHISFDGNIRGDSLTADINVPVTLTQIIHKVPKHKFLWWSWGCKAVKQVIVTDNPYLNIKYSEYIELK